MVTAQVLSKNYGLESLVLVRGMALPAVLMLGF